MKPGAIVIELPYDLVLELPDICLTDNWENAVKKANATTGIVYRCRYCEDDNCFTVYAYSDFPAEDILGKINDLIRETLGEIDEND